MKAGTPVASGESGSASSTGVAAGRPPRAQPAPSSASSPSVARPSVIGRPSCSMRTETTVNERPSRSTVTATRAARPRARPAKCRVSERSGRPAAVLRRTGRDRGEEAAVGPARRRTSARAPSARQRPPPGRGSSAVSASKSWRVRRSRRGPDQLARLAPRGRPGVLRGDRRQVERRDRRSAASPWRRTARPSRAAPRRARVTSRTMSP